MALTKVDDRGLKTPIDLQDNEKIRLGTGNDLEISHDGSNSYLDNSTGDLFIRNNSNAIKIRPKNDEESIVAHENGKVELHYDGSKKFETKSDGVNVYGSIFLPTDNTSLRIGQHEDLQMWHDNTNGYLAGYTGKLSLLVGSSEKALVANPHGSVELYYDNSKKVQTTSDGIQVEGTGSDCNLTIRNGTVSASNGGNITFKNVDGNGVARDVVRIKGFTGGSTGGYGELTLQTAFANTLNDCLIIRKDKNVRLPNDDQKLQLGASQDLEISHEGGSSVIKHVPTSSGELQLRTRIFKVHSNDNTEVIIKGEENGAVRLYHNGSEKLVTTSGGATVTGTVTATTFSGDGIIPAGGIIIWSGASNAIPTGWLLCDGSNSTPDLRNRFVVGAGDSYSVGATGGSDSVTLTTNQIPSHNHSIQIRTGRDDDNFSFNNGFSSDANTDGGTFNSNSTGGGQSHENRPPYYALCYIMKS